jgi:predicted SnoaL-like aldol condensation-catalyzing enzyme
MANSARDCAQTQRTRQIITAFADLFYRQRDVRGAFLTYVAPGYIQHNPGVADGRDAAIAALAPMFATPGATFAIKRIVVDGNLAVIHLMGRTDPSTAGAAVVDIYRLDGGKIVEHWDVLQPMPASARNPHPMF